MVMIFHSHVSLVEGIIRNMDQDEEAHQSTLSGSSWPNLIIFSGFICFSFHFTVNRYNLACFELQSHWKHGSKLDLNLWRAQLRTLTDTLSKPAKCHQTWWSTNSWPIWTYVELTKSCLTSFEQPVVLHDANWWRCSNVGITIINHPPGPSHHHW